MPDLVPSGTIGATVFAASFAPFAVCFKGAVGGALEELRGRLGTLLARPGLPWGGVGWGSWLRAGAGVSPAGTGQTLKLFSNLFG